MNCPHCGTESSVSVHPYGNKGHQAICAYCGVSGLPASSPTLALEEWSNPKYTATIESFPRGCRLIIDVIFEKEFKVGWKYEGRTYLPGSGSYYPLAEAMERAYRAFVDSVKIQIDDILGNE